MSDPQNYTSAQASDPQTPGQVLADIAALRPDLRPAVAANPSAYPGLLEWLGSLGEPSVNAALAARQAAPSAPAAPQQPAPSMQMPAQGYTPAGAAPAAAYGQPAAPGGYGQPAAPGGYGQPGAPGGYGYQGTPPAKKSHRVLWIVLGVVGLLIVLGIVAVALIFNAARNAIAEYGTYGSDTSLDPLWDRCEGGDWQACDDLYWDAPLGSSYETYGDTCGNRQPANTNINCVDAFGGGTDVDPGTEVDPDTSSSGGAFTYGDDAYLDGLWDACAGGDLQACDDLYFESDFGTEYETFGDTCGGRQEEGTGDYCAP